MVEKGIRYEKLLSTNSHRLLLTAPDRTAKLGNVDDAVHPMDAVNLRQLTTYGISIQEEGVLLVKRPILNFIGSAVTAVDDVANGRTNITITSSTIAINVLEYVVTGDNTTTEFTFTHNLNNRTLAVTVSEAFSPNYEEILPRIFHLSTNTIKVVFQTAPLNGNNYNVVVIGNQKTVVPGGSGIGSGIIGSTFIIG